MNPILLQLFRCPDVIEGHKTTGHVGRAAVYNRVITLSLCATVLLAACGGGGGANTTPAPQSNGGTANNPVQGVDSPFSPPQFSGSYAVGKTSFHWVDNSRNETLTSTPDDKRELMVHLYYPTDTVGVPAVPIVRDRHWTTLASQQTARGRVLRRSNYDGVSWPVAESPSLAATPLLWPVIVFSHGGGGAIERNLFLINELASNGYVVAAVNHTHHTDFVRFPDGRLVVNQGLGIDGDSTITPAEAGVLAGVQILWARDQIFVVDQLLALHQDPGGDFEGRLDLTRLATAGFSLGGAAAYEAASRDSRIAAVIDLDGSIWPSDDPGIFVPMLWVQSGAGSELAVFNRVSADGYVALFDNAVEHLVYEDQSLWWRWDFPSLRPFGSLDSLTALRSTSELMRQFLGKYLDGGVAPALDDPGQAQPGTRVRWFP